MTGRARAGLDRDSTKPGPVTVAPAPRGCGHVTVTVAVRPGTPGWTGGRPARGPTVQVAGRVSEFGTRHSSHLLVQMLAPAYQLSVRDRTAPAYQLSALDHSQVIGDQTFYFLSERLSETLFIGQPLQRLPSAASERPQKNRRTFCDDNFHSCLRSGPGQRPGPSCDAL